MIVFQKLKNSVIFLHLVWSRSRMFCVIEPTKIIKTFLMCYLHCIHLLIIQCILLPLGSCKWSQSSHISSIQDRMSVVVHYKHAWTLYMIISSKAHKWLITYYDRPIEKIVTKKWCLYISFALFSSIIKLSFTYLTALFNKYTSS